MIGLKYLIKSLKWTKHYGKETWYMPNDNGYTHDIARAGIYTEDDKNNPHYHSGVACKVIQFVPVTEKLKKKGIRQLIRIIDLFKIDIEKAQKTIQESTEHIELMKAKMKWFSETFPTE